MAKLKTWLTALLALQLILAGSLLAFNYQRETGSEPAILFDNNTVTVDRLEISDGESTVTVIKTDEQWHLPEQDNLPATESKITATLDNVAAVEMVWPVSTTSSSHERFEVAENNHQREVKLFAGEEEVAHFYIGTSPGFRKVHMREADSDEVYAISLNAFDFPVAADQWLEKSILNVADADAIQGPDFSIAKDGEDWRFSDSVTPADTTLPILNQDKAKQLVTAFSNFRVATIADSLPDAEPVTFTVSAGDQSWQFEFYQADETYYVQRDDRSQVFTLSKYDFERLAQVSRETLVLEMAEATDKVEASSQETSQPEETADEE